MKEYGLTVLIAAAVTYLLTPLVRRFAIAVGALHAARDRDVHTEPTSHAGRVRDVRRPGRRAAGRVPARPTWAPFSRAPG